MRPYTNEYGVTHKVDFFDKGLTFSGTPFSSFVNRGDVFVLETRPCLRETNDSGTTLKLAPVCVLGDQNCVGISSSIRGRSCTVVALCEKRVFFIMCSDMSKYIESLGTLEEFSPDTRFITGHGSSWCSFDRYKICTSFKFEQQVFDFSERGWPGAHQIENQQITDVLYFNTDGKITCVTFIAGGAILCLETYYNTDSGKTECSISKGERYAESQRPRLMSSDGKNFRVCDSLEETCRLTPRIRDIPSMLKYPRQWL